MVEEGEGRKGAGLLFVPPTLFRSLQLPPTASAWTCQNGLRKSLGQAHRKVLQQEEQRSIGSARSKPRIDSSKDTFPRKERERSGGRGQQPRTNTKEKKETHTIVHLDTSSIVNFFFFPFFPFAFPSCCCCCRTSSSPPLPLRISSRTLMSSPSRSSRAVRRLLYC